MADHATEGGALVAKSMTGKDIPIRSLTGATRSGAPLAASRRVADDLAPWFYWISAAAGELAATQTVRCGMLSDQSCVRILFGGTWTARTVDGPMVFEPGERGLTLYFGPQTRYMPISVTGSYQVITLTLAAGAPHVLDLPEQETMLDRIVDYDALVGDAAISACIPLDRGYGHWLAALESRLRTFIAHQRPPLPDPVVTVFDRESLARPDFRIADFANYHGVSQRTVERGVRRAFGLAPKQVLRRARALDTAARLLGVTLPEEEHALELRYYDQPHQSREVRRFFGMTPGELARGAHPMLRLNIELRQSRRLLSLAKVGNPAERPWRDPAAEPEIDEP